MLLETPFLEPYNSRTRLRKPVLAKAPEGGKWENVRKRKNGSINYKMESYELKITSITALCFAVRQRGAFFATLPVFELSSDSIFTTLAASFAWCM